MMPGGNGRAVRERGVGRGQGEQEGWRESEVPERRMGVCKGVETGSHGTVQKLVSSTEWTR